ncbi:MAG: hypothetical protein ACREJC_01125 [Tepidisphaeraceae bacterium]
MALVERIGRRDAVGLAPARVLSLNEVNERLARLTGWAAVPVTGFLPAEMFFALLAERRFPVTVKVRRMEAHQVEAMRRLFWFTVEFGLVRENGQPMIYGSGLVSSSGDAANALGDQCTRHVFTLERAMDQAFDIDRLQDTLFVLDSFDELFGVPERAAALVGIDAS